MLVQLCEEKEIDSLISLQTKYTDHKYTLCPMVTILLPWPKKIVTAEKFMGRSYTVRWWEYRAISSTLMQRKLATCAYSGSRRWPTEVDIAWCPMIKQCTYTSSISWLQRFFFWGGGGGPRVALLMMYGQQGNDHSPGKVLTVCGIVDVRNTFLSYF